MLALAVRELGVMRLRGHTHLGATRSRPLSFAKQVKANTLWGNAGSQRPFWAQLVDSLPRGRDPACSSSWGGPCLVQRVSEAGVGLTVEVQADLPNALRFMQSLEQAECCVCKGKSLVVLMAESVRGASDPCDFNTEVFILEP